MSRTLSNRRFIVSLSLAGAALSLVAGCGYSASQEYTRIRSIVVPAHEGDGTVVASITPWGTQPGLAKAIASADHGRDRASDSVVIGD